MIMSSKEYQVTLYSSLHGIKSPYLHLGISLLSWKEVPY